MESSTLKSVPYARVVAACLLGIALWLGGGCSRAPIPDYVLSETTQALPDRQQQQIEQGLIHFFGTPLAPRLLAISDEAVAEDVEVDEDEADEDSEADSSDSDASVIKPLSFDVKFDEIANLPRLRNGARVYRERCAGCHGISGDGNGPAAAYLLPKPRDYRKGVFKFTSTPYGMKPARSDLIRTIRRGAKGTSMPAFPWLSDADLYDVIDYVILLSQRGEVETNVAMIAESDYEEDDDVYPEDLLDALTTAQESWAMADGEIILPISAEPAYDEESISAGREAFLSRGCSKCHGEDGKGQTEWLSHEFLAEQADKPEGQRIQINYDAWGEPAPAADLTARMLHGGRRPLDIYRRIYTGINGTPMPAFGDALAEEPDTIWNMVHYVLSIVEGRNLEAVQEAAETDSES